MFEEWSTPEAVPGCDGVEFMHSFPSGALKLRLWATDEDGEAGFVESPAIYGANSLEEEADIFTSRLFEAGYRWGVTV